MHKYSKSKSLNPIETEPYQVKEARGGGAERDAGNLVINTKNVHDRKSLKELISPSP